MTLDEAVSLMRGVPNTELDLTIQRDEEVFDVHIVRELINVESVPEFKLVDEDYRIGYVEIQNFSERTHEELVKALEALNNQNQQALIIDLRFQPWRSLKRCPSGDQRVCLPTHPLCGWKTRMAIGPPLIVSIPRNSRPYPWWY